MAMSPPMKKYASNGDAPDDTEYVPGSPAADHLALAILPPGMNYQQPQPPPQPPQDPPIPMDNIGVNAINTGMETEVENPDEANEELEAAIQEMQNDIQKGNEIVGEPPMHLPGKKK